MKFLKENLAPVMGLAIFALILLLSWRYGRAQLELDIIKTMQQNENTNETEESGGPQTVIDEEGVLVQYCGIDLYNEKLFLYVENHRDDLLSVYVDNFAINSCKLSMSTVISDVAPGEGYHITDLSFDLTKLSYYYGVSCIEDVTFHLTVDGDEATGFDYVEKMANIRLEEPVEIKGMPAYETMRGEGSVLEDSEDVYVEFLGIESDSEYSGSIDLYVENRSDDEQWWSIKNVRVNDCYVTPANYMGPLEAGLEYRTAASHDEVIAWKEMAWYGVEEINTLDFVLEELYSDFTIDVHIDDLKVAVPAVENEGVYMKKHVLSDESLDVFFCGIAATGYWNRSLHDYYLSFRVENGTDQEVNIRVENLQKDGILIDSGPFVWNAPENCIYQTETNWGMDFQWDPWDEAGKIEFEVIEFDLTISYEYGETTIPVCIRAEELM